MVYRLLYNNGIAWNSRVEININPPTCDSGCAWALLCRGACNGSARIRNRIPRRRTPRHCPRRQVCECRYGQGTNGRD